MGLFDKLKKIITKKNEEVKTEEKQEEVEIYDKGLEKTRKEFVSQ